MTGGAPGCAAAFSPRAGPGRLLAVVPPEGPGRQERIRCGRRPARPAPGTVSGDAPTQGAFGWEAGRHCVGVPIALPPEAACKLTLVSSARLGRAPCRRQAEDESAAHLAQSLTVTRTWPALPGRPCLAFVRSQSSAGRRLSSSPPGR